MQELEVARKAARVGGEVISHYWREGVAMRSKPGESVNLVSEADVEAEKAIVAVIRESFPGHAVLAEEGHADDVQSEDLWIVDPLDGTNNFAHHLPHFAVSVAYWKNGRPECGVIYNPIREDWYECVRGGGSTYNGESVRVGRQTRLDEVFIGVGFYYDRGAMMERTLEAIRELFGRQIHGIRRFGTASLDLAHVGLGCYGAYFEYQLSPWDFAAGQLFVEEAGGKVTTARGEELPLAKTSLLASNGPLHEAVLEIVRRRHP